MARYRLVSVKLSRREHKRDDAGNHLYKDDDKKVPVYEVKQYGIGEDVELSAKEARRLKKDIQPIGGSYDRPVPLQFEPDDGNDEGDIDPAIAKVLAGGVDKVVAYINDHADDEDTLEALRTAEQSGKARKTVLDALNDLLGE